MPLNQILTLNRNRDEKANRQTNKQIKEKEYRGKKCKEKGNNVNYHISSFPFALMTSVLLFVYIRSL